MPARKRYHRGKRPIRCCVCGRNGDILCDFPLKGGKPGATCDLPLCADCRVQQTPDVDYCPAHAKLMEAGGVKL